MPLEHDPNLIAVHASAPSLVTPLFPSQPSAATAKPGVFDSIRAMLKETDARKRGQIYCSELREFCGRTGVAEVLAANSLGTVAPELVTLKALDLLKLEFPVLSAITTDFSDKSVLYGQSVTTRVISPPTVTSYNETTGYASSDATTSDVSVTINAHRAVQIEINSNELGSTNRDLFGEQVEASLYAIGKDLVDALYAVITAGNFTNVTTQALATFTRTHVKAMGKALTGRGVSPRGRSLLLNLDYHDKLLDDATLVQLAAYSMPGIITEGQLPRISKFQPIEAVNLPSTGNLTGFGFTKDALVIAARLPEDYTKVFPGAAHGSISTITNPDVGISVLKTDFVDHRLARAYSRLALTYGVAKGNGVSGQRLVSA